MKKRLKIALWILLATAVVTAPVAAGLLECWQHANQVQAMTGDDQAAQRALTHCCAVEGCTIIWY